MQLEPSVIAVFDIASRRKASKVGVATPRDFDLKFSGTVPVSFVRKHGILYCADFENGQALYTLFDDPTPVFRQPFLYAEQYDRADRVACVPFHMLDSFSCDWILRPTFLFSAGRCGSTLLAELLRSAGLPTASEADLLTQLASRRVSAVDCSLRDRLQLACVSSLADHLGPELAVKLRSQCNSLASDVARVFAKAKFVFILRDRMAWVRSRFRAFPGDPKAMAHMYRATVHAYNRLRSADCRPILVWYEDIVAAPSQTLGRLAAHGLPLRQVSADTIADIMRRDSQAGTHLAARKLARPEMSAEEIKEFDDEWHRIMSAAAIEQLRRVEKEIPKAVRSKF